MKRRGIINAVSVFREWGLGRLTSISLRTIICMHPSLTNKATTWIQAYTEHCTEMNDDNLLPQIRLHGMNTKVQCTTYTLRLYIVDTYDTSRSYTQSCLVCICMLQ